MTKLCSVERGPGTRCVTRRGGITAILAIAIAAAGSSIRVAYGLQNSWTGSTSTDWSVSSNWSRGVTPGSTDDLLILVGTHGQPVLSSLSWTAHSLANALGATLTQTGGTLTLSTSFQITSNGSGSYTNTGGSLVVGSTFSLFSGATAVLGGGVISSNTMVVGADALSGQGTFTFNSGTLSLSQLVVGNANTYLFTWMSGANFIWNGGLLNVPSVITLTGGGNFELNAASAGPALSSNFVLGTQAGEGLGGVVTVTQTSSGLELDGTITGAGGLAVHGGASSGGLVLLTNTNNSYSGGTYIRNSTLTIADEACLGTGAVTVEPGGIFVLLGQSISSHSITLNGSGYTGNGALASAFGASSWAGTVALASDSGIGGVTNLAISGVVSGGHALTKLGSNTLTLSGSNTYTVGIGAQKGRGEN